MTRLRINTAVLIVVALLSTAGCKPASNAQQAEVERIAQWRTQRIAALTGEHGWLTLVGLYWLNEGENRFGRGQANALVLNHPAMPELAGVFELHDRHVSFAAHEQGVTHNGEAITRIDLQPDTQPEPTVLEIGSLRFNAIERAGKFGVRVRDIDHPARRAFRGIDYFSISDAWRIKARFEPYTPAKSIAIVNILGMTENMQSPGALVFEQDGKTFRLDAILESAEDKELFIMFTDLSSGRESYGAGRYLYVPKPTDNEVWLDFNQAYNPPCAFTEFATCPLPPRQNRLALNVNAGEKKYAH